MFFKLVSGLHTQGHFLKTPLRRRKLCQLQEKQVKMEVIF